MPEGICGFATSSGSICDWRGRGGLSDPDDIVIDDHGSLLAVAPVASSGHDGWLPRMMESCHDQLSAAYSENVGVIRATKGLEEWMEFITKTHGRPLTEEENYHWKKSFVRFFSDSGRPQHLNEAGFYIRLVEWMTRRLQRRWYIERTKMNSGLEQGIPEVYYRLRLPLTMTVPEVPSLLPFHTVCDLVHTTNSKF